MKTINSFVAFLSVMFFGACTANIDDVEASDKIPVEVTFSGINISVIPDENQVMVTLTDFTLHFSCCFTKILHSQLNPLLNNFTMQEKCY